MKRSPELSPLSRDHHHALYAALLLKRADNDTAEAAAEAFLDFWNSHGHRHFRIEEEVLLPGFAASGGDVRHELVARVLTDHVEIRARAKAISGDASVSRLNELGERLTAHVRLEEDELFPLIERSLDLAALEALGKELDLAERAE